MRNMLKILTPRLVNVLITLVVISLPLLGERARLPDGTITETVFYRPIFLLTTYLQMQDWQPFLLMVGFVLVVYMVVSAILAVFSRVIRQKRKK